MTELCPIAKWPEGNATKNSHVNLEKDLTAAFQITSALVNTQTGLGTNIIIASTIYRIGSRAFCSHNCHVTAPAISIQHRGVFRIKPFSLDPHCRGERLY